MPGRDLSDTGDRAALLPDRGTRVQGYRIAIVTHRPRSAVEVHPRSANSVNMAGVTVEYYPPGPAMG